MARALEPGYSTDADKYKQALTDSSTVVPYYPKSTENTCASHIDFVRCLRLQVEGWLLASFECLVYRRDCIRKICRERTSIKRVEALLELLDISNRENDGIPVLSIQNRVELGPSQRSCVPADTVFLRSISNNCDGVVDLGEAVRPVIGLTYDVLSEVIRY